MTSCDEIRSTLAAYADGQLSALENDAAIAHLEQCGRCRQIVRDQQRVQRVLDAYQPPAVNDAQWNDMARRLRHELEGKGEKVTLKTRSRVEALEPTPVAMKSLAPEEVRAPMRPAEMPQPAARPRSPTLAVMVPSVTVFRVHARRRTSRFGWVAHMAGMAAAAAVVALAMRNVDLNPPAAPAKAPEAPIVVAMKPPPKLDATVLARQGDVDIIEIDTLAPGYNVTVYSGNPDDVIAVWVVPAQS